MKHENIWRKLTVFGVLLFFILSIIPSAIAEEGTGSTTASAEENKEDASASEPTVTGSGTASSAAVRKVGVQKLGIKRAIVQGLAAEKKAIRAEKMLDREEFAQEAKTIREEKKPEITEARAAIGEMKGQAKELKQQGTEESQKAAELLKEQIAGKRQEIKAVRDDVKRDISAAKDEYLAMKKSYEEEKVKFNTKKTEFGEKKEQLKQCKDDKSENCIKLREDVRAEAKPFLISATSVVIESLEKIKANVQSSEDLSDEESAAIIANIDEKIAGIKDAAAKIDALGETATKEEINEAARLINQAWQDAKPELKRAIGRVIDSRMAGVIVKSEQLLAKLSAISEQLANKGKDTADLDEIVSEFEAKIAEAKKAHEEAKSLLLEGKVQEGHDKIAEAKTQLKEAKKLLRDAVNEIKSKNRNKLDVTPQPASAAAPADEAESQRSSETNEQAESEGVTAPTASAVASEISEETEPVNAEEGQVSAASEE